MQENDQSIPTNEAEADALIEAVESPESSSVQDARPQTPSQEFSFTASGKEIKLDLSKDRDKLVRWAQLGHEAPTRIGQLNQEIEKWKSEGSKWNKLREQYEPVDQYVKQNPKFWEHVLESYKNRDQMMNDPNNPLASTVSQLAQRLESIEKYKNSVEERQNQARVANEDQEYVKEFETIKKQYPKVDFLSPDENGKTLEFKVLEYAHQNGLKKFTTAFRDFYHDELMKLNEEGAKEKLVKDKQKQDRLGILGITPTPTKRMSDDVRGKSYSQLAQEAIDELNLN